ncbi:MAG: hypothetical protein U9N56_10550 [Actinomycetota bacterium]|nr:hypothetical protein [Actinomycetota bacterium]
MQSQQPVEMILLRQAASYLTMPIWMMDEGGNLIFYNGPAEKLLGVRFDDAGPLHADQLAAMFKATNLDGEPIEDTAFPVVSALVDRKPSHREIRFCGLDGVWRDVHISAMPVEGQAGRFLGVFATFWESAG